MVVVSQLDTMPEARIKQRIEARLNVNIDSVVKSKIGDLYEIASPEGMTYTDKNGDFLLLNAIVIDTKTKKNITVDSMAPQASIPFADFPLADAITVVHGKGTRHMVTFEDPNCGYCKKQAAVLAKMDDVTIHTFLLPILGDDSVAKSNQVWCAADRAGAWQDWMNNGVAPTGKADCDVSVMKRNAALAEKTQIHGTPVSFFMDGTRAGGAQDQPTLEAHLSQNIKPATP